MHTQSYPHPYLYIIYIIMLIVANVIYFDTSPCIEHYNLSYLKYSCMSTSQLYILSQCFHVFTIMEVLSLHCYYFPFPRHFHVLSIKFQSIAIRPCQRPYHYYISLSLYYILITIIYPYHYYCHYDIFLSL